MKLLLFDIDGTLIRTAGAGRRAMERSFEKVYGHRKGFRNVEMMGRTDPDILMEGLANHGLVWREEEVDRFREYYFWFLEEEIEIPHAEKRLCPGVSSLLNALHDQPNLILGLLTGNWRYSGFVKLRHFGIEGFFPLGAFGDDARRREELVPVILDRFKRQRGISLTGKDVFVIGDTPLDIRCAKPHGVCTVGVATGFHTMDELASEGPDYLFPDFGNTQEVVGIFHQPEGVEVSK